MFWGHTVEIQNNLVVITDISGSNEERIAV